MKRSWIWIGFGALLLVGILSGYAPDFMLASALGNARAEGLLTPSEKVAASEDARSVYLAATKKYPDGWNLLNNDFVRQVKAPAPHVAKYLDAMAEASKRPRCSVLKEDWNGAYYGMTESSLVFTAAKAIAVRAHDEASLRPAARIARHLRAQSGALGLGYGAVLVDRVLDRAIQLRLPLDARRRLSGAMGSSISSREAFRRHVAATVESFEERTRKDGSSVNRTRQEGGYLRFWRGFFASAPSGSGFLAAVRKSNSDIETAENRGNVYIDLTPITGGTTTDRWAAWAALIERTNERLATGR